MDDRSIEFQRYETRALNLLRADLCELHDLNQMPLYLREPYIRYYEVCAQLIKPVPRYFQWEGGGLTGGG